VTVRLPPRSGAAVDVGLGRIARFGLRIDLEGVDDVAATLHEGAVVYWCSAFGWSARQAESMVAAS
jgi:hypothetical protein